MSLFQFEEEGGPLGKMALDMVSEDVVYGVPQT